jgi:hypothetical protein
MVFWVAPWFFLITSRPFSAIGGPPCFERVGDLDGNCAVNWADLAILVDSWLWGF